MFFIFTYQLIFTCLYPFLIIFFTAKLLIKGDVTRWRQLLFGKLEGNASPKDIWIHGVSGGEITLIKALLKIAPNKHTFHLTTSNGSGYQLLEKEYIHSQTVSYSYHPLDIFFIIIPWLKKIKPKTLIVIEHDQWPCLLYYLNNGKIPRYLINIEFKPRDLKRYKWFPFPLKYLFNFSAFTYQNAAAQEEGVKLGLDNIASSLFNQNLKFLMMAQSTNRRPATGSRKKKKTGFTANKKRALITLGSTHCPEEKNIVPKLFFFQNNRIQRQLCIIPRDPTRAPALMRAFNNQYNCAYLSSLAVENDPAVDIYIVDTMGLSLSLYAISALVIIGDSFRPTQGGHNFLEPLYSGTPCVYGQHLKIFSDITPQFEKMKLTYRCTYQDLAIIAHDLLSPRHVTLRKYRRHMSRRLIRQCLPPKEAILKLFEGNPSPK